jgi:hypothetical protein
VITLKIVITFADIEKIVDEALGIAPSAAPGSGESDAQTPENKPAAESGKTGKTETTNPPKN